MTPRLQTWIDARFPYWRSTLITVVAVLVMGLGVTKVAAVRDGGQTTVVVYLVVVGLLHALLAQCFKLQTDRLHALRTRARTDRARESSAGDGSRWVLATECPREPGDDPGNAGDCNARIEYQGATYRTHNLLSQSAPTEPAKSGSGDVVGCEGEAVDQVDVTLAR